MQYTVVGDLDQHLATTTWKLLTMLDQLISPPQSLVTTTKHLQGTSTKPKTQIPFLAEARNSLHRKLKSCTLFRTLSALHRKVNSIEDPIKHNL